MYRIMNNGRPHYYETLEAAIKVANEIWAATGIFVGIDKV